MRFKKIDWCTDDQFYEDTETGLLMVISGNILPAELEATLQRRSEALIERLAIKIKQRAGRKRKDDGPWAAKIRAIMTAEDCKQDEAVVRVAHELEKYESI